MPRYFVRITAEVVDVLCTVIAVEARDREDAADAALNELKYQDAEWSVRDCGQPYNRQVEDIEEENA